MTSIASRMMWAVALVPVLASAATVSTLSIAGTAELTANTIDFAPFVSGAPYNGTGQVVSVAAGTGAFAGVPIFQQGSIVDRDYAGGAVPPQPVGGPISVPNWLTFPGLGNLALDLTNIYPGSFSSASCGAPPALAQTCTPDQLLGPSPFNFTNFFDGVGLSSSAMFSASGNVRNVGSNATVGGFMGVFTITFDGRSYQQVEADMFLNSSAVGSFSGTIRSTDTDMGSDVVTPEPATSALILAGVALIVARRRRST